MVGVAIGVAVGVAVGATVGVAVGGVTCSSGPRGRSVSLHAETLLSTIAAAIAVAAIQIPKRDFFI
jgi:hypothetical protein